MQINLQIDEAKVESTLFCGVDRLGRKRRNPTRPRPTIARFICRADRDQVWRQRTKLQDSPLKIHGRPAAVREIRRNVLVPSLRRIKKNPNNKATIVGDKLLVNGRRYTYNNIPRVWQTGGASLVLDTFQFKQNLKR